MDSTQELNETFERIYIYLSSDIHLHREIGLNALEFTIKSKEDLINFNKFLDGKSRRLFPSISKKLKFKLNNGKIYHYNGRKLTRKQRKNK